ncbi:MAG: alpha/beta fold hydrolase [Planctomycetota bacterium]
MISCLHGFMGHPTDWDFLSSDSNTPGAAAFDLPNAEKCQIHALDIESHVDLAGPGDWHSDLSSLAGVLPSRSILLGYSMGARLALGIALTHPEKVRALVFVSGNPGLEDLAERRHRANLDQLIASRMESDTPEKFLDWWYQLPVFAGTCESVRAQERQRKSTNWSSKSPDLLRKLSVSRQPNYWPQLKDLAMPVQVLASQRDEKYRCIAERMQN